MAIYKTVETEIYCDVCGEYVKGWHSGSGGVSLGWAAYFARQEGCTTGQKIICKKCRIKERMKKCGLMKRHGEAGVDNGACLGFSNEGDDEPIEKCKNCIACSAFDWEKEKYRLSHAGRHERKWGK